MTFDFQKGIVDSRSWSRRRTTAARGAPLLSAGACKAQSAASAEIRAVRVGSGVSIGLAVLRRMDDAGVAASANARASGLQVGILLPVRIGGNQPSQKQTSSKDGHQDFNKDQREIAEPPTVETHPEGVRCVSGSPVKHMLEHDSAFDKAGLASALLSLRLA